MIVDVAKAVPIETEVVLEPGLVGRIDHPGGGEQDVGDVARHEAEQHEDQHRDAEQREQHQEQATDDVGGHDWLCPCSAPAPPSS